MKLIKLTRGLFAKVDDCDFEALSKYKWQAYKMRNGFYAGRRVVQPKSTTLLMHREILEVVSTKIQVDHEDRDTLNNQRYNLRKATNSQNQCNRFYESENNMLRGLVKAGDKWRVRISINKKRIAIGTFADQKEAAEAYNEAAKQYHGEFARINIIPQKQSA